MKINLIYKKGLNTTKSPWESVIGYSRAVQLAPCVRFRKTATYEKGIIVGLDYPYTQTVQSLMKLRRNQQSIIIMTGGTIPLSFV